VSGGSGREARSTVDLEPEQLADVIREVVREVIRQELRSAVAEVANRPAKELLTADEAAGFLGVSARYVRQLSDCGTLPDVRLGRARRWSRTALQNFVERGGLTPVRRAGGRR
jgi:excisionase family DNA binding protein